MIVAILHDDVVTRTGVTADQRGVLEAVDAVDAALRELGHDTLRIVVDEGFDWATRLHLCGAQAVFNLCESIGGRAEREHLAAAAVELLGLPMTGSTSDVLALARRKDRVNALLGAAGLPVPAWALVNGHRPDWSRFPAIVKPAGEDASVGITRASIVDAPGELERALDAGRAHAPLLVQEFVSGREFNVAIVGDTVLPVAEIDFAETPDGEWPLVTYAAKWEPGSPDDAATLPVCPARLDERRRARIESVALQAWRLLGGCGYGRVDLREDAQERLYVLEINPNPDLSPSAGLTRMARVQGWSYTDLVSNVLAEALA